MLVIDVRCYIILYIDYYYYILYIIYYILLLLLYYIILFSSSVLPFYSSQSHSSSHLPLPISSCSVPFLSFPSSSLSSDLSPIPSSSSLPSQSSPLPLSNISFKVYVSVLTSTYLYSFTIFKDNPLLIYLPFFLSFPISSSLLFPSSLFILLQYSLPFHSRNTCRHLDPLIYILSVFNNLTPHVLSEWMVEV